MNLHILHRIQDSGFRIQGKAKRGLSRILPAPALWQVAENPFGLPS
jgi:hypothetical protein